MLNTASNRPKEMINTNTINGYQLYSDCTISDLFDFYGDWLFFCAMALLMAANWISVIYCWLKLFHGPFKKNIY